MRTALGDLDKRIAIMRAGKVDNGMATVDGEHTEIGRRWAKKTDVSDGEKMQAGENASLLTSRFLVLSDSLTRTITGEDRIAYKGRTYFVTGVKEAGEREDAIEITTSTAVRPPEPPQEA